MSMDAVFQALVLTSGSYNFRARQWALALHFVSESQHDSLVRRHSLAWDALRIPHSYVRCSRYLPSQSIHL